MKYARHILFLLLVALCLAGCNCGGPKPEQYDTTPEHEGEDWESGEYPPEEETD